MLVALASSASFATEIYLICRVSGVQTINTLEKKKITERDVNIKINENKFEITFDVAGMPGGSLLIRGLKGFQEEKFGFSHGRSDEEYLSASSIKNYKGSSFYGSIEINRVSGHINLDHQIVIPSTFRSDGYEVDGVCKSEVPKRRF